MLLQFYTTVEQRCHTGPEWKGLMLRVSVMSIQLLVVAKHWGLHYLMQMQLSILFPEGKRIMKRLYSGSFWEKQDNLSFSTNGKDSMRCFLACNWTEHIPCLLPSGSEATPHETIYMSLTVHTHVIHQKPSTITTPSDHLHALCKHVCDSDQNAIHDSLWTLGIIRRCGYK